MKQYITNGTPFTGIIKPGMGTFFKDFEESGYYLLSMRIKLSEETAMELDDIYGDTSLLTIPSNEILEFDKLLPIKSINISLGEETSGFVYGVLVKI